MNAAPDLISDDRWIRHAYLEFVRMCPEVRDALLTLNEQNFYTMTMKEFAARIERAKVARAAEAAADAGNRAGNSASARAGAPPIAPITTAI